MTERLPPFVIVNEAGAFRTGTGSWSTMRQDAASFHDAVSATDWMLANRLGTSCRPLNSPYTDDIEEQQRKTLGLVSATGKPFHTHDYEPEGHG